MPGVLGMPKNASGELNWRADMSRRDGLSWLPSLLGGDYFTPCLTHAAAHKSERNFFCADCAGDSLCAVCIQKDHVGHATMQIRRSSYHDAVRIVDVQKLLDISGVQVYVINSAKIVFLNGRPQKGPLKEAAHSCETCHRALLDACRFCSLNCKRQAVSSDESVSILPHTFQQSPQTSPLAAHLPSLLATPVTSSRSLPSPVRTSPPSILHLCTSPPSLSPADRDIGQVKQEDSEDSVGKLRFGGFKRVGGKRPMPPLILVEGDSENSGESLRSKGEAQFNTGIENEAEEAGEQLFHLASVKRSRYFGGKLSVHPKLVASRRDACQEAGPATPPAAAEPQWRGHRSSVKGVPHRAALW